MIQQFENVLTNEMADSIEQHMLSTNFDWKYVSSISGDCVNDEAKANDPNIKDCDGFMHMFVNDGDILSDQASILAEIITAMEKRLNKTVDKVERSRAVLLYKNPTFGDFHQGPHTDYEIPHMVMIYYVNDSDGDTIFFEERHTGVTNNNKKTISERISPKKNKCIVFDGLQYHTGSIPKDNHRVFININLYFRGVNVC